MFSSGNDETMLVKYCQMHPSKLTSIAGSKLPNAWGLHDMHGNVFEWCSEIYRSEIYMSEGSDRVFRGGSWDGGAAGCRSECRSSYNPSYRYDNLGFRLALSPSSESLVKVAEAVGEGTEGASAEQRPELP